MTGKYYAVIVAGGSGSRMGGAVAKQFMTLGNKPVLAHTVERFLAMETLPEIIMVLPEEYKQFWKDYCFENRLTFRHTLVSGGITRFHSVRNALSHITEPGLVAVHDGVRPFVTTSFLQGLYDLAEEHGAVIPVTEPVDSMRVREENGSTVVTDRSRYLMVQTPQVFNSRILLDAYKKAYLPSFTDDASVVESAGTKIFLAPGKITNIKITRPDDLVMANALLNVF
ncbi:MAG: 2-C-methyl-D-erythritol 4-phosphate cytidylyltransferase [Bacteroidia bacterium]|nr:2-C-methyl-D-erythritol 4-phosphate cytidylyltransferase [Bacteroidia bacterium]